MKKISFCLIAIALMTLSACGAPAPDQTEPVASSAPVMPDNIHLDFITWNNP